MEITQINDDGVHSQQKNQNNIARAAIYSRQIANRTSVIRSFEFTFYMHIKLVNRHKRRVSTILKSKQNSQHSLFTLDGLYCTPYRFTVGNILFYSLPIRLNNTFRGFRALSLHFIVHNNHLILFFRVWVQNIEIPSRCLALLRRCTHLNVMIMQ